MIVGHILKEKFYTMRGEFEANQTRKPVILE